MIEPHTSQTEPADFEDAAFANRQRAMVEAGTHPLIADRLARDAARGQTLRDERLKLTGTVVHDPALATERSVVTRTVPVGTSEDAPDLRA